MNFVLYNCIHNSLFFKRLQKYVNFMTIYALWFGYFDPNTDGCYLLGHSPTIIQINMAILNKNIEYTIRFVDSLKIINLST